MKQLQLAPGVTQLVEPLGVCMTLLQGTNAALLVDAGYGLEDVNAAVSAAAGGKRLLAVLLTHGHHDHALGAMRFPDTPVWLFPADGPVYETYTGREQRERVLSYEEAEKLDAARREAYLSTPMPKPVKPPEEIDLGGMKVRIIETPGHTPGSAVVLVNDEILITGDDWNMTTWLFFREALPVREYRKNMEGLMRLPFRQVICSHQPGLYEREKLERFVSGLTDEALAGAEPCPEGTDRGIDTVCLNPAEGQRFVFDRAKL